MQLALALGRFDMPVGEMQVEGHIGLFYFLGAPAQGATFLGHCRGNLRFCLGSRVCTQRTLRSIDILPRRRGSIGHGRLTLKHAYGFLQDYSALEE